MFDFKMEVNHMYNFSNRKNKKMIVIVGLVLVAAMLVTTLAAAFI